MTLRVSTNVRLRTFWILCSNGEDQTWVPYRNVKTRQTPYHMTKSWQRTITSISSLMYFCEYFWWDWCIVSNYTMLVNLAKQNNTWIISSNNLNIKVKNHNLQSSGQNSNQATTDLESFSLPVLIKSWKPIHMIPPTLRFCSVVGFLADDDDDELTSG